MSQYMSKTFWLGSAERAIKTLAQTLLAMLTLGTTIWNFDWIQIIGVGLTAVAYSILTSIADPGATDTARTWRDGIETTHIENESDGGLGV